jgi:hypothetical protein
MLVRCWFDESIPQDMNNIFYFNYRR